MKKHRALKIVLICLAAVIVAAGICGWAVFGTQVRAASTVERLDDGLYMLEYKGDYGFDEFLAQGGASSDERMADYIASFLTHGLWKPDTASIPGGFGCSTIAAATPEGGSFFGRNFDWTDCEAMIVHAIPKNGYESVSTCCLDFLGFGEDWEPESMLNKFLALAAVYVPLDGMNERGLCVADLMAGDDVVTHQDTDRPDLTVTSAIRLLLDKAATVDEAVDLLSQYDMNSSIGTAHHLSISDASGRSVVVEYIDGVMAVTETRIVTNHYLAECEKKGTGSEQSHLRFNTLTQRLGKSNNVMTTDEVRSCLQSVCQGSFPDSDEQTQWSIVFDQSALTARYYFHEDYENCYYTVLGGKTAQWLAKPVIK